MAQRTPVEKKNTLAPVLKAAVLTSPYQIDKLHHLFKQVAQEQGWQPGDSLSACHEHSVHFALMVEGEMAGGLQLVCHRAGVSFSCFTVWPELSGEYGGDMGAAHIYLLAVHKDYRGRQALFWPLCVEMWRYCQAEGITTLLAEVTPANLRLYRRLGWPLHVIGDLRPHWGEPCLPCRMDMTELTQSIVARAQNSSRYSAIVQQAFRGMPSEPGDAAW